MDAKTSPESTSVHLLPASYSTSLPQFGDAVALAPDASFLAVHRTSVFTIKLWILYILLQVGCSNLTGDVWNGAVLIVGASGQ
jgi:hypothetical protein